MFLSVCLSLRKSDITFDLLDGCEQNFQGPLNSSQVIFGLVTQSPGPSGSGPDPKKGGLCQIYLLWMFWGRWVVSHLFGIRIMRRTKLWEHNFNFGPMAQENGAERRGWLGGQTKFLEFQYFFMKGTPAKIWPRSHLVLCNFLIPRTPRAPVVTPGPGRVKIKSQNWGFLWKELPPIWWLVKVCIFHNKKMHVCLILF